jgi:hypothetical protein
LQKSTNKNPNGVNGNEKRRQMKQVIKKAAKYESKKSLDGPMKFLKGNVGKSKKNSISIKKK